ncbi:hypothetical protein GOODEAATRI_010915, partial [Goodea atripinnis]
HLGKNKSHRCSLPPLFRYLLDNIGEGNTQLCRSAALICREEMERKGGKGVF